MGIIVHYSLWQWTVCDDMFLCFYTLTVTKLLVSWLARPPTSFNFNWLTDIWQLLFKDNNFLLFPSRTLTSDSYKIQDYPSQQYWYDAQHFDYKICLCILVYLCGGIIYVKRYYAEVIVLIFSESLYILSFTIQELALTINGLIYFWHSVMCCGTHKKGPRCYIHCVQHVLCLTVR